MLLDKYIPANAKQIRYIHPLYEDDGNDDSYCVNEDVCTDIWYDCVKVVHEEKIPIYFRRRTSDLASNDVTTWNDYIGKRNKYKDDFNYCTHVFVKKVGKRVLFIYNKKYTYKMWVKKRIAVALSNNLPSKLWDEQHKKKAKMKDYTYNNHRLRIEKQRIERRLERNKINRDAYNELLVEEPSDDERFAMMNTTPSWDNEFTTSFRIDENGEAIRVETSPRNEIHGFVIEENEND